MRATQGIRRTTGGLLWLVLLLSTQTLAQLPPALDIGDATGAPGSSVSLPVAFSADGAVSVAQFDIVFDADRLALTSVAAGAALTPNHSLDTALIAPGRQRVVITTASAALLGSGTLASLTFAIDATAAAGNVPLTWDGVVLGDAEGLAVTPGSLAPGAVTVTGGAPPPPPPPPSPPEGPSTPGAEPQSIPTLPLLASLLLILLLALAGRRRLPAASAAVLLCAGLLLYSGMPQAQPLRGDANGDGVVNVADILVIVNQILGRGMAPGDADCNADGVVNVLDTVCSAREIVPGSTPPQLIAPGDRTIPVDVPFAMNLFALDPDPGETLTFTLDSGPAGVRVNASGGVLSWTPGSVDLGTNSVSVRVTDSTAQSDTAMFSIAVTEDLPRVLANSPPQLVVPENQITRIGTPLALQALASDPDPGDSVTFSLVSAPAGMTINPETGSLGWTPGAGQRGLADVVVRATDTRDAAAFGTFTVDAREINRAPVARDDIYVARKGETLLIDAAAGVLRNDSDPDDDSFNATLLSHPTKGALETFGTDGSFAYSVDAPTPITIGLVEKCSSAARVVGGAVAAGDVDRDGVVELVSVVRNADGAGSAVFIVDPVDCSADVFDIPESLGQAFHEALPVLVNLDDDPELEIVTQYQRFNDTIVDGVAGADERLYAVKLDGTPLDAWVTTNGALGLSAANSFDVAVNRNHMQAAPVAVDLNGDGNPALIAGFTNVNVDTTVPNTTRNGVVAYDGRTGAILWEFIGGITRPISRAAAPTVVDLDLDGDPEIIWSQHVLDHEGNLLFDLPVEQTISGGGSDFLTVAIANFDNDAYPEIISFDASNITLYSHTGAIQWQRPYNASAFQFPWSDITVAELDGDPFPEFVIVLPADNGTNLTLRAFDSDGEDLWDQAATGFVVAAFDESRNSSPVAIDLDGDGIDELIQLKSDTTTDGDAAGLYIIDGATGGIIDFQPGDSNLRSDQTLTVADVDGDGSADIVTNMGAREGRNPIQIWSSLPGEPFADARPFRSGANGQPTWANVDGSLPARIEPHWLQPGRNGWNRIQPDRDPYEPEQDSFTYRVSDGALDSNTATVNLEIRPAGNPPFFLSEPRAGTSRGVAYTYTPLVVDVDPGDVVSFELVAGPLGMTLDPESGRLDWNPEAIGQFPVSILASDTLGFSTAQIFRLRVGDPVLVPDVIGLTEPVAGDTLNAANLRLGERSLRSDPVVPSGELIDQSPPAGAVADFGSAVRVTVSSGAGPADSDADGDGFTPNQGDCNDSDPSVYPGAPEIDGDGIDQNCNGIDGNKTLVAIEVTPGSKRVLTNQPIPLTATGIFEDGTAQDLTAVASWSRGPTFFSGTAGNVSAEASFLGVTGSADFVVLDRVADEVAPVARIDSPEAGAVVTAPTDIVGVVTDSNLLRWELAFRQDGQGDFVRFAEGSSFIGTSRAIASFDPTTLLNGLYTIRLQVFDRGGNVSEDTTTVLVDSQLKVGNFTLRYVDLELPLNGIPITLVRNYDSRDKRVGDFGVGWRLGVSSVELRTNRELGSGWRVFRQGLTYSLIETDAHIAALRFPSGRIEAFRMMVTPSVSPIVPFPPFSQSVRFEPLPGTLGSLQSLEANNISILDAQPGPVTLRLDSNGDIYNPTLFRYTASDGTQLDIDSVDGIQRAQTPGGQVLTFTATSITHSNGKSVSIERDALGRITGITDPAGFEQRYRYDANGDLREHSDPGGFTTRYDYDANHNVIGIRDPLGRPVARNAYDEAGRLVRTTNADGRVVQLEHDVAGRQEIVTDVDGGTTVLEYDDRGNVLRITDPLGHTTTNTYDANGNQLSTTNALGETTTRTFDARNNTLSETDPLGNTTAFTYDAHDNLTSVTDALGRIATYRYDARGNLVSTTDTLGNRTESSYDEAGNLIARTDPLGNTEQYGYDESGNRTSRTDARGNTETFAYDANGNPVQETDRRGVTLTTERDARGLPTEGTDPAGRTMLFEYSATRVLSAITDPDGNTTRLQTDADGKETAFTDALGNRTEKRYSLKGHLTTLDDASGDTTGFSYDAAERRTGTTLPDGASTQTRYDAAGRIVEEEDALGNVTRYAYDAAGRNTRVTDALGNETVFAYDAVGNLLRMIDARGETFEYRYDAMNQRIRTTFPDGSFTQTGYDDLGQVISETDALGRVTRYDYDANGNLLRVTDALGGETRFTYDAADNRTGQTDARGNTTRFTYDDFGRLLTTTYPDGSSESRTYDEAGNIASETDANGTTTAFEYDAGGRLVRKIFGDGSDETYTYSVTDQVVTATNSRGTVHYDYDAVDRLVGIENPDGSSIRYGYDATGNRSSDTVQGPSGGSQTTTYGYDALNRLQTVTDPQGRETRYTYDAVGNLVSLRYPNGVVSDYRYDANNRLNELIHRGDGGVLAHYDYTVNPVGDRTRVTDRVDGSYVEYVYDSLRRLTRESHFDIAGTALFALRYEYDAVGNRTALIDIMGNTTLYRYDAADKLLAAGDVRFLYDANGNRLGRSSPAGETRYRFDPENQLVGVTTPGASVSYAYDAQGERVQRSGAETSRYLVDPVSLTGHAQVLADYDDADIDAHYVFGSQLLSRQGGGQARYYHNDANRNIRLLTDEAGAVTDRYDYSAFGELASVTGKSPNLYGFAGERYDPETGLTYLRARYYEPATGRFISRDPFEGRLRDPMSLHRYLYANANPIAFRDPSGLFLGLSEVQVATLIGATVGGVSSGVAAYAANKRGPALVAEIFIGAGFGAIGGAFGGALATAFAESKVIFALLRNPVVAKYGARLVYAIPATALNLAEDLSKGVASGDWRKDGYFRDVFLTTGANLFFNTLVGPGVVEARDVKRIITTGAPSGETVVRNGEVMYKIFRDAGKRARDTRLAATITQFPIYTKETLDEGSKILMQFLYEMTKLIVSEAPNYAERSP